MYKDAKVSTVTSSSDLPLGVKGQIRAKFEVFEMAKITVSACFTCTDMQKCPR